MSDLEALCCHAMSSAHCEGQLKCMLANLCDKRDYRCFACTCACELATTPTVSLAVNAPFLFASPLCECSL